MPANIFELRYYGRNQTRGRPRVKLVIGREEISSSVCKHHVEAMSPGAKLRAVILLAPQGQFLMWDNKMGKLPEAIKVGDFRRMTIERNLRS